MSQVEMSEGSLLAQNDDYDMACQKFAQVKAEYPDLLAEDDGFAVELDSRLACALVEAAKYSEAIQLLHTLFRNDKLKNTQRLQLFWGVALLGDGKPSEAEPHLFEAMIGSDQRSAQSALDYLSTIRGSTKPVV